MKYSYNTRRRNPSAFTKINIIDLNKDAETKGIPDFVKNAPPALIQDPSGEWDLQKRPFKEWTRHIVAQAVKNKPPKKNLFVLPSTTGRDIQILNHYKVPDTTCRWVWAEMEKDKAKFFEAHNSELFGDNQDILGWKKGFHLLSQDEAFDFAWFDLYGNITWKDQDYLINRFNFAGDPINADVFFTFAGHGSFRGDTKSSKTLINLIRKSFLDLDGIADRLGVAQSVINEYFLLNNESGTASIAQCKRPGQPRSITRSCALDDVIISQLQELKYIFNGHKGYDFDCDLYIYNDEVGSGNYHPAMLLFHLHNFKKTNIEYFGQLAAHSIEKMYELIRLPSYDDNKVATEVNAYIKQTFDKADIIIRAHDVTRWRNLVGIVSAEQIADFNVGIELEKNLYNTIDSWPADFKLDPDDTPVEILQTHMAVLANILLSQLHRFLPFESIRGTIRRDGIEIRSPMGTYKIKIGLNTLYYHQSEIQIIPAFLREDNFQGLCAIFRRLFCGDPYLHPQLCPQLTPQQLSKIAATPCTASLSLPQEIAYTEWQESWNRGDPAGLIVLPTGMGKTWVAAEIARAVLHGRTDLLRVQPRIPERRNKKILFIAHQSEILNQAVKSFQRLGVINANQIGILYTSFSPDILRLKRGAPEDQFNRDVVFATPQTLDSHLDWLTNHPDHFTVVIFDEAHHTTAETWSNVATATEACEYRLGFTATPFRLDKNKILPMFASNLLSETTLSRGIYLGYLVDPTYVLCKPTSDAASEKSRTIKIPELLAQPEVILAKLSEKLIKNGKLLRTVVFCDSVRNARSWLELITEHFQQRLGRPINGKVLHDETPKTERDETYVGFNSGLIDILFVKGLFDEGVDVPGIEGIVFLRQTKSLGKVLQQMGRGLRLAPGKRDVVVIDFISNYTNLTTLFQLMTLLDIGGPGKFKPRVPRTRETPPIDDDLDEAILSRLQIDRDVRVYIQNEYEKEKEIGLVEKVAALRARRTPLSEIRRELQVSRGGLSNKQFAELYRFRVPEHELKKSPNDLIKHALDILYQGMRDIAYKAEPGQKPTQTKEAGWLIISNAMSQGMYNTMWDCFERGLSYEDFCKIVLEKHQQELIVGRRRLRRY